MNEIATLGPVASAGSYAETRFNAIRHAVLSHYTVLPWEDETEYRALLDALVAEHAPEGPTEEHLVEELAGVWRKRRLRMAEAATYREKLRDDAGGYRGSDEHRALPCCRSPAPQGGRPPSAKPYLPRRARQPVSCAT
jgi:hypothetical protein